MTTWMQTGKDSDQTWYHGDYSCNTGFKSAVTVRDKEGMPRTVDRITAEGETEFVFPQVGNGDRVIVDVETLGDNRKAKSDRVTINLSGINFGYMMKIMEQLLATKTDEEKVAIAQDTSMLVDELLPLLSPSSLIVNVRSQTITTNADGIGQAEMFVEREWPGGPLFVNCHYGYSATGERTDSDKSLNLFLADILPFIVDMALLYAWGFVTVTACTVGSVATLGATCVVFLAASAAVFAAEMGYVYHRLQKDGYGSVDVNKYACRFPTPGGFNHTYTLNLVETLGNTLAPIIRDSPNLQIAGEATASNHSVQASASMSRAVSRASGPTNQIILVMLVLVGTYFLMGGEK